MIRTQKELKAARRFKELGEELFRSLPMDHRERLLSVMLQTTQTDGVRDSHFIYTMMILSTIARVEIQEFEANGSILPKEKENGRTDTGT